MYPPERRASVGGDAGCVLSSRVLSPMVPRLAPRLHAPLAEAAQLETGTLFDTAGVLILATPPQRSGVHKGWEIEVRHLYLADESCRLLCLRWQRPRAEPLRRLLIGHPLTVLNASLDTCDSFRSPQGCEQLLGGPAFQIPLATADSIASYNAVISGRAGEGATHLREAFERLQHEAMAQQDQMALLAAVATELVEGRLSPLGGDLHQLETHPPLRLTPAPYAQPQSMAVRTTRATPPTARPAALPPPSAASDITRAPVRDLSAIHMADQLVGTLPPPANAQAQGEASPRKLCAPDAPSAQSPRICVQRLVGEASNGLTPAEISLRTGQLGIKPEQLLQVLQELTSNCILYTRQTSHGLMYYHL